MYTVRTKRTKGGGSFKVHSSRLLRFLGPSVPAPEDGAQSYWGISVLEPIYEAITKVDNASFNILNLTFRANLLGIEFPQLEQILSGVGGTQEANKRLEQRLSAVNAMMSNQSLIPLPKDGKLEATSYTFSGLAEVYQLFQLELSGGSGIPVTRLWGRTYSGLGGTANEGDEKVYDEKIASDQATYVLPQLEKMYPVICMSELGEVPADLDLVCPSIRVLDEKEKAELAKAVADTLVVYQNGGIMSPRVVGREVKQSSDLTGVGTNLTNEDIEKLSDKVQAEGEMGEGLFGEGKGGLNAASGPAKALKEEDKAGKEKLQEVPEDEDEDAVAPVGTAPAMDLLPAGVKPGSKVDVNGKQLIVRKVTTGTSDLFGEPTVQVAFTTGEVVAYSVPDEEKAEDAQVDEDAKVVAQVLKVNGKTAAAAKVRELTTGQPGALFDKALAILIPGNDRNARLARNDFMRTADARSFELQDPDGEAFESFTGSLSDARRRAQDASDIRMEPIRLVEL
jgi:hypothetical protein